jgi:hypothetical protein
MTTTTDPGRRLDIEAACARMNPDTTTVAAVAAQIRSLVCRPDYLSGYVAVLEKAINTIHEYHARDCVHPGCATCTAVRIAITATTAHHLATGGPR